MRKLLGAAAAAAAATALASCAAPDEAPQPPTVKYADELGAAANQCPDAITGQQIHNFIAASSGWKPQEPDFMGRYGLAGLTDDTWEEYGNGGDPNNTEDAIAAVGKLACSKAETVRNTPHLAVTGGDDLFMPGEPLDADLSILTWGVVFGGQFVIDQGGVDFGREEVGDPVRYVVDTGRNA